MNILDNSYILSKTSISPLKTTILEIVLFITETRTPFKYQILLINKLLYYIYINLQYYPKNGEKSPKGLFLH